MGVAIANKQNIGLYSSKNHGKHQFVRNTPISTLAEYTISEKYGSNRRQLP